MGTQKKFTELIETFLQAGTEDSRCIPEERLVLDDMYLFVPKAKAQPNINDVKDKKAFLDRLEKVSANKLFVIASLMVAGEVRENDFCYASIGTADVKKDVQIFMIWPTEIFSQNKIRLWLAKNVGNWRVWRKKNVNTKTAARELQNLTTHGKDFPGASTTLNAKRRLTGQNLKLAPPPACPLPKPTPPPGKSLKRKNAESTATAEVSANDLSPRVENESPKSPEPIQANPNPSCASNVTNADVSASGNAAVNLSQNTSTSYWPFSMPQSPFYSSGSQFVPTTSSPSSTSAALAAPSMVTAVPKTPDPNKKMMEKIIDAFVFDVMEIERDGMNTKPSDNESPLILFEGDWNLDNFHSPGLDKKFSELVIEWQWMIAVMNDGLITPLFEFMGSKTFDTRVVVFCPRFTAGNEGDKLQWYYRDVGSLENVDTFDFPNQTVEELVVNWKSGNCIPSNRQRRLLTDVMLDGVKEVDSSDWEAAKGHSAENLLCPEYHPEANQLVVASDTVQVANENNPTSSGASGSALAQNLLICASLATAAVVIGVLARKAWLQMQRNAARRRRLPSLPISPAPQPANTQEGTHQNASVDLDGESTNPEPTFVNGSQKKSTGST
eukprot:GHVT01033666.1.p1 GENE.GHVT01033666.1~~GHVT01033666.1.p1  ORF type:complete len:611 (+),score=86.93 GHVT01033666.1:934-2766(+)